MNFESPEEIFKIIEGKKYKRGEPTGYTVRQYYSHSTPEKCPGLGWDSFVSAKESIAEEYGISLPGSNIIKFKPEDLPDEPHYMWYPVEE